MRKFVVRSAALVNYSFRVRRRWLQDESRGPSVCVPVQFLAWLLTQNRMGVLISLYRCRWRACILEDTNCCAASLNPMHWHESQRRWFELRLCFTSACRCELAYVLTMLSVFCHSSFCLIYCRVVLALLQRLNEFQRSKISTDQSHRSYCCPSLVVQSLRQSLALQMIATRPKSTRC